VRHLTIHLERGHVEYSNGVWGKGGMQKSFKHHHKKV
jgi:hypothetical protein